MLRCWGCVGSEWITSCFPKPVRKQMAYVFGSSKKAGIWATEKWGIRIKEMKKLFIFSVKYFPSLLCITIKSEPHRKFSFYSSIYKQRLPFVPNGNTQMMIHFPSAVLISHSVYQLFH